MRSRIVPTLWFLLCVAMTFEVFAAAILTPDTLDQLAQARTGVYRDHHPPIMALVMRPFALLHVETGIVVAQASLYWLAVLLLLDDARKINGSGRVAAAIPFLIPSTFALIGVVWKDVHLALAWSLAFVLIHLARREEKTCLPLCVLAGLLVIYGAMVRHNAFVAVPPMILFLLRGKPWLKTPARTVSAYFAIAIAALIIAQGASRLFIGAERSPSAALSLPMFDVSGITVRESQNAFPIPLRADQIGQVRSCYSPVKWDPLYYGNSRCRWLLPELVRYEQAGGSVTQSWLRAIATHPSAYLQHRGDYFFSFLFDANDLPSSTHRARFGQRSAENILIKGYAAIVDGWWALGLMEPVVALIWAVGLLVLSRGQPQFPAIATTCLVAILNLLSHLPFGVASDQRYAFPSFVILAFGTALRIGTRESSPSPAEPRALVRA